MDDKNIFDLVCSEEEIMAYKAKIEEVLKKHWISFSVELIKSLAWIAGGAGISYFTYCSALEYGGTYFMFYGAILYGIIRFLKVLFLIPDIREDIEYDRKRLWQSVGCSDYKKYYDNDFLN